MAILSFLLMLFFEAPQQTVVVGPDDGMKVTTDAPDERRDFLTIRGKTDFGTVTIKHPDPVSSLVKLVTGKPNRKKGLTIQYLEFPAR